MSEKERELFAIVRKANSTAEVEFTTSRTKARKALLLGNLGKSLVRTYVYRMPPGWKQPPKKVLNSETDFGATIEERLVNHVLEDGQRIDSYIDLLPLEDKKKNGH